MVVWEDEKKSIDFTSLILEHQGGQKNPSQGLLLWGEGSKGPSSVCVCEALFFEKHNRQIYMIMRVTE